MAITAIKFVSNLFSKNKNVEKDNIDNICVESESMNAVVSNPSAKYDNFLTLNYKLKQIESQNKLYVNSVAQRALV
ncbi:hypothetical protein IJG72_02290 [bacterium]|nr:hypothetical protein [bacterium]